MSARQIDLNSDVGESFGNYKLGLDEELIPLISSANIACGFHAGDPTVLRRTVALARDHGVAVGAHPGLPDLMGFGRRTMEVTQEEIQGLRHLPSRRHSGVCSCGRGEASARQTAWCALQHGGPKSGHLGNRCGRAGRSG